MKKTNSKEVKEAVRKYIIECIEPELSAKQVYSIFLEAYYKTDNQKRYFNYNERKAFKNWLSTIPYGLNIEFATWEICKIVGDWLGQSEKEIENYFDNNSMKSEELFKNLITREFYEIIKE